MLAWRLKSAVAIAATVLCVLIPCSGFCQSDFKWTFEPVDSTAWAIQNANDVSSRVLTSGPYPISNPTLQLPAGKRYEITIINPQEHPFQIIAKGVLPDSDIVLLSAGDEPTVGDFESDPGVGWKVTPLDTQVKVEFTLTQSLINAMREKTGTALHSPGYRCGRHPAEMRGDFIILGVVIYIPSHGIIPVGTPTLYTPVAGQVPYASPTPTPIIPTPTPTPQLEPVQEEEPRYSKETIIGIDRKLRRQ